MTASTIPELPADIAAAHAEILRLRGDLDDLQMLYDGTIEHGEAVEDSWRKVIFCCNRFRTD
jgi:hypothetical protein